MLSLDLKLEKAVIGAATLFIGYNQKYALLRNTISSRVYFSSIIYSITIWRYFYF